MVRLADRMRQMWDQVTSRESAYQPYKEEENEEEDKQKSSRGDKSDQKKGTGARVVPPYQGGGKRQNNPGLQGKSEEVNLKVEAALMDSRTFLITLSCRGLRVMDTFSKSDPMCVVFRKCGVRGEWEEVGRTETLENTLDPEWQTSFTLDYFFHQTQNLRFVIYDIDDDTGDLTSQDPLGTAECRLGQVVAAPGHQKELYLSPHKTEPGDCGVINVRAEELADGTRDRVTLEFATLVITKVLAIIRI